ncbi:MAG: hypothetical protein Q9225_007507 [Loekoesia sp. 1 TL-2023]
MSSAFGSPIFTIYAGPNRRSLLAHSGVLSKSPTLRKIVEGEWKDSKSRIINLEEWEEQTVEHVLEWLYSGSYTLPVQVELGSDTGKATKTGIDHPRPRTRQQLRNSRIATPLPAEIEEQGSSIQLEPDYVPDMCRPLTPLHDIQCSGSRGSPTLQSSPAKDGRSIQLEALPRKEWGQTLLPDAKVYVLAQYLQLIKLKQYAFHHIQDVLVFCNQTPPGSHTLVRIVDLARYVYSSTDSLTNSEEPLRKLVSTFVVEWFVRLDKPEFERLIAQGGDFAVDVTRKLRRHWQNILEG